MRSLRLAWVCCALAGFLSMAEPAAAAWNNVFQVTCLFRQRTAVSSYYVAPTVVQSSPVVVQSAPVVAAASPCCDPCPQTQCTTSYVQRCYYQPVTTYQTQTYYQPVTTYRTSYYYEPVCSYSYSCYYDPCTCSYQQVATPTTSYQLRAQCCPVQSWVQRCSSVPVTSYQRVSYWQPQTTCCQVAPVSPCSTAVPVVPSTPAVVAPAPATTAPPVTSVPPSVTEQQALPSTQPPAPPPSVQEERSGTTLPPSYYRNYSTPSNGGTNYQPPLNNSVPPTSIRVPQAPATPPQVRLDRIASNSQRGTAIQGQVVNDDNAPKANVQLLFVNADRQNDREAATASADGRFDVSLASGRWLVYIRGSNGQRVYHSRIDVEDRDTSYIRLVSR